MQLARGMEPEDIVRYVRGNPLVVAACLLALGAAAYLYFANPQGFNQVWLLLLACPLMHLLMGHDHGGQHGNGKPHDHGK